MLGRTKIRLVEEEQQQTDIGHCLLFILCFEPMGIPMGIRTDGMCCDLPPCLCCVCGVVNLPPSACVVCGVVNLPPSVCVVCGVVNLPPSVCVVCVG